MFKSGIDRKPNQYLKVLKKIMLFARLRPSISTCSLIVHVQPGTARNHPGFKS